MSHMFSGINFASLHYQHENFKLPWYNQLSIYHGPVLERLAHISEMTKVNHKSDFELPKETPYLTRRGKIHDIWDVFYEFERENVREILGVHFVMLFWFSWALWPLEWRGTHMWSSYF